MKSNARARYVDTAGRVHCGCPNRPRSDVASEDDGSSAWVVDDKDSRERPVASGGVEVGRARRRRGPLIGGRATGLVSVAG